MVLMPAAMGRARGAGSDGRKYHWRIHARDPAAIAELSRSAAISPVTAHLLLNRGISDPERARAFLDAKLGDLADPETIPGAVEAAERIVRAIRDDRKIVIYGDYDVDGVCGTSILWSCLKMAGASEVEYYIPHRVDEGYGVNADALRKLASEHKASLIVTVDCGISAVREAEIARELGVEYIVTDHHTIGLTLPRADAIVHPRLPGGLPASADLCGAGVAFKLAWQVSKSFGTGKRASPHMREFLMRSLGHVALATIADVMPLSDENRILVRRGLEGIGQNPTPGLRALLAVSGSLGKRRLTAGTVGFNLAPRINAAGRIERAMMAVELLTTDNQDRAAEIASELDRCNTDRKAVEIKIVEQARAMLEAQGGVKGRGAIVLAHREWHVGVIGIVASRMVDLHHRPTVILAIGDEHAQGSARSIPGFDLYEAIKDCSEGLLAFGGHPAAAGLKVTEELLPVFAQRFEERCRLALEAAPLERALEIDAEVPFGVLNTRVVEEIEKLEPHGLSNPRPLLLASNVRVEGSPRIVGEQKKHVQLRLGQDGIVFKAIAWGMADRGGELAVGTRCSVVFQPSINEWNGRREVQLEVRDFEVETEVD
jgi:single-stranded-DNA-specific exonuclease